MKPLKIYVAGRYTNKLGVRAIQKELVCAGHSITHDWTTTDGLQVPAYRRANYEADCALKDLCGVREADALVLLDEPGCLGAYIDVGYAIAEAVPFIVMLPARDSIFYRLAKAVLHSYNISHLLQELSTIEPRKR